MRAEDIQTYKELQEYIKYEIVQQTITRKTVEITLNDEWFFKFHKFVRFTLKHDTKEKGVITDISQDCKKFILKINGVFTIVTRK